MAFQSQGKSSLNHFKVKMYSQVRRSCLQFLEKLISAIDGKDHENFIAQYSKLISFPLELYLQEKQELREP